MPAQMMESYAELIVPIAIILIVATVLIFCLTLYRRQLAEDQEGVAENFSIGELRKLHKAGQMTEAEFERAKARLVADEHARTAARAAKLADGEKSAPPTEQK